MVAHTTKACVGEGGVLELAQQISTCLELVVDGDDFTNGGGDDFDRIIFSYGVGLVTNRGVVFTWEMDPWQ